MKTSYKVRLCTFRNRIMDYRIIILVNMFFYRQVQLIKEAFRIRKLFSRILYSFEYDRIVLVVIL